MTELEIPRLACKQQAPNLAEIHDAIQAQPHHAIDQTSWAAFPYRPDVRFALAYTDEDLVVHFTVRERAVLACRMQTNESVCRDSCVELFLTPPGADDYINIEFNCIGTVLGGRGPDRASRGPIAPDALDRVRRASSLGDQAIPLRDEDTEWDLVAAIPLDLLDLPAGADLPGVTCRANLYKCGEDLPTPHYVSWRPIDAPEPDFHRPEYFGPAVFV